MFPQVCRCLKRVPFKMKPIQLDFVFLVPFGIHPHTICKLGSGCHYSLSNNCTRGVLVVELGQLAHDLAAALVLQRGNDNLDGNDLVAALARLLRVFHAAIPHPELLAALRAGGNLQLRAAVDCRNIYLRASEASGTVTGTVR